MDANRGTETGPLNELDGGPGPAEVAAAIRDFESESPQKFETGAALKCPRCSETRQGGHLLNVHLRERHLLGADECYRLVGKAIGESKEQAKK